MTHILIRPSNHPFRSFFLFFLVGQGESGKAYRAAILSIGTRLVDSVMAAKALEAR